MASPIVLIRHGITDWNQKRLRQGQANIPLNDKGRQQAHLLAQQLKDYDFSICYSSPMSRALETAEIVLEDRRTPIIKENLLLEQAYGLEEGTRPYIPFTSRPNASEYNYQRRPELYQAPLGGESFEALYDRAESFLHKVLIPAAEAQDRTILVASHSAFLSALEGIIFKIPVKDFWSMRLDTCGYAVLKEEKGFFTLVYQPAGGNNFSK